MAAYIMNNSIFVERINNCIGGYDIQMIQITKVVVQQ
jgi:hypothetical protein